MADQMRFDHLTPDLTPHLWNLGARGLNFQRAYASSPICPASRASLLTGLSPWRHGLRGYGPMAPKYTVELPDFFAKHGYRTASIGKTHFGEKENGEPQMRGFQEVHRYEGIENVKDEYLQYFEHEMPGQDPLKSGNLTCKLSAPGGNHTGWCWNTWIGTVYEFQEQLHPTTWTADLAIRWLQARGRDSEPWLLKVSFHRPHSPYDPPQRFFEKVGLPPQPVAKAKADRGNRSWDDMYRQYGRGACTWNGRADTWCGEISSDELEKTRRAYRASVAHVDEEIGRVLQAADLTNTWVVFVADHGDMQMDHYLWRKTVPYEGAVHIPMILTWPLRSSHATPGHRYDLVELRDVLPTLASAVGLGKSPELAALDGLDMTCAMLPTASCGREILELEADSGFAEPAIYHWNALTNGAEKYVRFASGSEQLFNLSSDPREEQDLSKLPRFNSRMAYWRDQLARLYQASHRGEDWVNEAGELVRRTKFGPSSIYSPNYQTATSASFLRRHVRRRA
eukprot:TRINITY_DN12279_c0_g1_i1.p1 TRINITY_DN12279_c0_g1~~TRINITY_DN12279_c0_g1_i1.p1  ORF type:complete len:568 (+),score=67.67 TRINITY_DN12279_c0_g1_i1:178-1704(+)